MGPVGGLGVGRRSALLLAAALLALALVAGCGDNGATGGSVEPPSTSEPGPAPAGGSTTTLRAGTTTAPATSRPATTPPATTGGGHLEHPSGFGFDYPKGWEEAGPSIASEFAAGAECAAAKIVDFEPPAGSGQGPAGFVLQSVVQICARPADGSTLDAFMQSVYPDSIGDFERTTIGGLDAYRLDLGTDSLAFVQSDRFRFQMYTSVAADPEHERTRIEEVRRIVESVSFE